MTSPNSMIDSAALLRYIGGESPAEEKLMITQWIAADPARGEEVLRLSRAWALTGSPTQSWPTAPLWSRIEAAIRADDSSAEAPSEPRRKPLVLIPPSKPSIWRSTPFRIAAGVLLVAGGVALAAQAGEDTPRIAGEVGERTYTTKPGELADLRLNDGTRVVLGGSSTLRIPGAFGATERELHLDGQAYFEVTHDPMHTLRVHTQRSVAQDLGTRFVVTAYSADSTEQVAVTEGTVAVQGTGEAVILRANDVGHVSAAGAVSAQRNVDVERHLGWMSGVVHFDNAVLGDAVKTLQRQHGIDIRIASKALAGRRFTGSLGAKTLHEDLAALALLLDAKYERLGDTVVLRP